MPKPHDLDSYSHPSHSRTNNPKAGLAPYDPPDKIHSYKFDPHFSPALDWSGKSEGLTFDVTTQSIHVHEVVRPHRIIYPVEKSSLKTPDVQGWLFPELSYQERTAEKIRAIESYKHLDNWTNRMIAGDSLIIMNSLIQKENMAGQVQTAYIDPPYGIKYGSNFQPFINKRDVKDKNDEDLTTEPEMIKAFRDTWELGIHSYLTYLRNRLLLVRELLSSTGSVFVQISDENVHHIREICDEIFGVKNFVSMIPFKKTTGFSSSTLDNINDYILFYAKNKQQMKYHQLYVQRQHETSNYTWIQLPDGTERRLTAEERRTGNIPAGRLFMTSSLISSGGSERSKPVTFEGKTYYTSKNNHWKTHEEGMKRLIEAGRIQGVCDTLTYKRFADDFPLREITNWWDDTVQSTFATENIYVVQTYSKVIQRCILMTSDPGDLVLDITCGSGTTAYVAEQWGRRWITCDTSRVALAIARQRLMTADFPYYRLANPERGLAGGFEYKTVPHVTLKSITNGEPPAREILYDNPEIDKGKIRITGPFTVEALPSPVVFSVDEAASMPEDFNEAAKLSDWREQLLATGIIGRNGERLRFSRIDERTGTLFINASAETDEYNPRHALICFANESTLMDAKRVFGAFQEALKVKPNFMIFAAFQFDPEAQQMIRDLMLMQEITALQVQMNPDLMTEDLKKKIDTDQSFWLVGQPDVVIEKVSDERYRVRVIGFDYYDPNASKVISGDADKISMWMLDPDYDGMSINPSQVFFPMEGKSGGWTKLAKTLKAEIDEELIEAYRGNVSLEFESKKGKQIAVKIIDDRGIESMRVLTVEEEK